MMQAEALLAVLHLGDSGFPSGAFAFSWGLEGLAADGLVTSEADLVALIEHVIRDRWATFDRIVLRRVYATADISRAIEQVVSIDLEVEAATWAAPLRTGSKRAGRALLGVHEKLGSAEALAYRARAAGDARLGHLAVAQGIVWRAGGLALDAAQAIGVWATATAIASAAVRLGIVGHLGAQAALAHARRIAPAILAEAPDPESPLSSFAPLLDVALMRHDRRAYRLFAT